MSTIGWLALIVAGIALGFGIGRAWPSRKTKLAELEQERDQARKELGAYREEVGTHFERTAELFDKVTADYRSLYEHLALSARQLGAIQGEPAERSLTEPEQRRLAAGAAPQAPVDAPQAPEAPPADAMPETDGDAAADAAPENDAEAEAGAETEAKAEAETGPESPRRGDS